MWNVWLTGEVHTGFWTRARNQFEDLGLDGRIILKRIFKKLVWMMDWIALLQDRDRWRALVNVVMRLQVL
jgi:hypothetical protein